VALFLVPPLVQAPVLLCLAVSAWVGCCVYLSLFDRTPRSYAFLLAGYSATIIAFSVVNTPLEIFDTAVSRVEEISLGIICATVAHSIFFPRSILSALNEKIASALSACSNWIVDELGHPRAGGDTKAAGLSAMVADMQSLRTQVAFETSDVPRKAPIMAGLIDRLSILGPFLSAAETALEELRREGPVSMSLQSLLDKLSAWVRAPELQAKESYDDLQEELKTISEGMAIQARTWCELLEAVVVDNVRKLVESLREAREFARSIASPDHDSPPALANRFKSATRHLHRDPGLALLSAASAAAATLFGCALWIGLSWPEGAVAAQFAAIGCSLFATLDNPAKVLWQAVIGVLVALPVAAVYEFAILPGATDFESLALALLPILLLLSFMQTFEKLEGAAMILGIAFAGALALQPSYRADFAGFVNSNLAEIAGILIAIAVNRVFRAIDPAWNALRISRAGWRAVSALAREGCTNLGNWVVQMFDRVGLVVPRLALIPPGERDRDIDGLRDIRVGINLETLHSVGGPPAAQSALQRVFVTIADSYEARARGLRCPDGMALDEAISNGLAAFSKQPPSQSRLAALAALTGLRLDLASPSHAHMTEIVAA
jgi:uncharacterized membrane protein YccC